MWPSSQTSKISSQNKTCLDIIILNLISTSANPLSFKLCARNTTPHDIPFAIPVHHWRQTWKMTDILYQSTLANLRKNTLGGCSLLQLGYQTHSLTAWLIWLQFSLQSLSKQPSRMQKAERACALLPSSCYIPNRAHCITMLVMNFDDLYIMMKKPFHNIYLWAPMWGLGEKVVNWLWRGKLLYMPVKLWTTTSLWCPERGVLPASGQN